MILLPQASSHSGGFPYTVQHMAVEVTSRSTGSSRALRNCTCIRSMRSLLMCPRNASMDNGFVMWSMERSHP